MQNLAPDLETSQDDEHDHPEQPQLEIVHNRTSDYERESLSENFNSELEAWARHAIAANGFGDY